MSNPKAPPVSQALLDYLEDIIDLRKNVTTADSLLDLGALRAGQHLINHLRYVKEQQEKEGRVHVSTYP